MALQAGGQRFEPGTLHTPDLAGAAIVVGRRTIMGWVAVLMGLIAETLLLQCRVKIPEPAIVAVGPSPAFSSTTERTHPVKWVTRERPKTDRIACPWLIKNFIDPEAEFLYVPADQVLEVAERERAHSYDAPGATYTHRDGLCSFEVLVEDYEIGDAAVRLLARIVHGADVSDDRDATPQSRGLLAVAEGFHLLELGDLRQLELNLPVYDALYAWCRNEIAQGRGAV